MRLALGDSIAFGYTPIAQPPGNLKDYHGYPEIVSKEIHLKVASASCFGESTAERLGSREWTGRTTSKVTKDGHGSSIHNVGSSALTTLLDLALNMQADLSVFMQAFKRECRGIVNRFLLHQLSFPHCIVGLNGALMKLTPRLKLEHKRKGH